MSLLTSVPFASYYAYSPRGQSPTSARSRRTCAGFKNALPAALLGIVTRIQEQLERGRFKEFFGPEVLLVPTPRSAPLRNVDDLWPARSICRALVEAGLAAEWLPLLVREQALKKSSYAAWGERPNALNHLASFALSVEFIPHRRVTVVDDVVTKGATLLAAASCLHRTYQQVELRSFAAVRTMGLVENISTIHAPVEGTIVRVGTSEADRHP